MNEMQLLIIPSEHWEAHYIAECYLMAPGQPVKDNTTCFHPGVLHNTTAVNHYYTTLDRPYLSCFSTALFHFSVAPNPKLNQH